MLQSHFKAIEDILAVKGKLLNNAGHTLHKGNGREFFVKEFLMHHIGKHLSIGTGELINHNSTPKQSRNQWDVVIYNNKIPNLSYCTDVTAFLIESVSTLIEVKSKLTKKDLSNSIKAAKNAKLLAKTRANKKLLNHEELYQPRIFNYIFAYDSDCSMETLVKRWSELDKKHIVNQTIPAEKNKLNTPSESIDGIFILKKGTIIFDNLEIEVKAITDLKNGKPELEQYRKICFTQETNNLLMLFLLLTEHSLRIDNEYIRLNNYYPKGEVAMYLCP
ncbi:DUF6602 domain-containing protein [Priestia megaterium]|uniref:DUF6602 domain-containing protein n=1 Tax=Priestia megaterium TaxID=1404 RepID=UPI00287812A4|nr:DUF6602 domain-containing protein [Priestia megaterium]MBX4163364.1 hypothetical protein [Priestia megaterium]